MARGKSSPPANRYRFPGVDPDDRTLGGAVPPELFDRLQQGPAHPPGDVPESEQRSDDGS